MIPTVITARNVNDALDNGLWHLKTSGYKTDTRNGPVIRSSGPVITMYQRPEEMILWNTDRDANPFFHLMESIWMLAGRNDADFPGTYAKQMFEYAEPAGHIHGAYGYRWQHAFGVNQLQQIVDHLVQFPNSRRAVLQMWDARMDLNQNMAKDLPCNLVAKFNIRSEKYLDMTVMNRSNDIIWGAYGANAVHFSMLQKFMAECLDLEQGVYYQFSDDYHMYLEMGPGKKLLDLPHHGYRDRYTDDVVPAAQRMIQEGQNPAEFIEECRRICNSMPSMGQIYDSDFINQVVVPMNYWYRQRKLGDTDIDWALSGMPDCDWKQAALEWKERHESK